MFYKYILKPYFFSVDPETIHYRVFSWTKSLLSIPLMKGLTTAFHKENHEILRKKLWGLEFDSPVGLAAGFDKDAKLIDELACFGFGFIEIGTITPKGQPGNPKPRLFRLPQDQALINRMGFNNEGMEAAISRLKKRKSKIIVGGNIGKNKVTPNDEAVSDYMKCFNALFDHVDYFVVNVSSPNTPNLRALQDKEPLTALLQSVQSENQKKTNPKPILLKIAPDLNQAQLDDIIEIVQLSKIDGLIATNTTIDRSSLQTASNQVEEIGAGGLSGRPLTKTSTEIIRYLVEKSKGKIPIIAVGGIFTAEDAIEKLEAGAELVQVYTGFVYEGPSMVKRMNKGLKQYYESRA